MEIDFFAIIFTTFFANFVNFSIDFIDFSTDFSNWIPDANKKTNIKTKANQKMEKSEDDCNRRIDTKSTKTNNQKRLIKTNIIIFRFLQIDIIVFDDFVTLYLCNI